jgi:methionine sulfoxide reductase heme-binding subunit
MNVDWIKSNWRWSALNLFAVSVFVIVPTQGSTDWNRTDTFDTGLESGKWAIRFLLACLTMTPLNTYFGWSSAIKLRKSAGLWAFGFACLHVLLYIREAKLDWLTAFMPFYLALGLTGMVILSALAVTSNRWSMQRLGRNWKRLHRLVYFAGFAVVVHSLLALTMSKRLLFRDPQAEYELKIYMAVLCVLLVVRIPIVRQWLRQIPTLLKRRRKWVQLFSAHKREAELLPRVHGRESGASVKPTFIIPNEFPDLSEEGRFIEPFVRINEVSDLHADNPHKEEMEEQEAVAV